MGKRSNSKRLRTERVNSAALSADSAALRIPGAARSGRFVCEPSGACAWPRLQIPAGALEALKWIALMAMTIDHVNKYLLNWSHPWMFALGRLAFPLFALILAYKLSQVPDAERAQVAKRVALRLLAVGAVATVPFIAAGQIQYSWWWPLNVLLTLAGSAGMVWAMEQRRWALAALVFVTVGAVAEFFWPGLLMFVAAYRYFKRATPLSLFGIVLGVAMLSAINGNHWALAGLALFGLAAAVPASIQVPRLKRFFYAFYPLHLAALVGVQFAMTANR